MELQSRTVPDQVKRQSRRLGASLDAAGMSCDFVVWAPEAKTVRLRLVGRTAASEQSQDADIVMERGSDGYHSCSVAARAGDRYFYIADENKPVPDPVSLLLPEGVHGPSEIVDHTRFHWTDQSWRGLELKDYIIYELHVGTFTPVGTFDGVIEKLSYLKTLGISVIELMPVAAFPGERNWGYDGVSPFAVQASYGGPDDLKRLVSAAHEIGLAVILDVVYNHLGNEGNYLRLFGSYFTNAHKTPWGDAINYDSPGCEGVREYVSENALHWIRDYHLDGLRLDAVQTIHDDSRVHILKEIQEKVQQLAGELGRTVCVIAESDENDSKLVKVPSQGGYGLDAMWSDDFHHAVHAVLTGERAGYYQDFGAFEQIVRALRDGYVFQGEHFKFWEGLRGTPAKDVRLPANVICIQNHDQVGNRAKGERLNALASGGGRRAASALMLLAPHTPLLFMGEEYDETAPFQFFTSYGDSRLVEAVRKGRHEEFKQFHWNEVPDPQDAATFQRSRLNWELATPENQTLAWYRSLLELRRRFIIGAERTCRAELREIDGNRVIVMEVPRVSPVIRVMAALNTSRQVEFSDESGWERVLSAADQANAVAVWLRRGGSDG